MNSVVYKYLDKRAATIAAIRDYNSMQFIIDNTDEKIKTETEKMVSVHSPVLDGMPHTFNPNAREEKLIDGIEKIDILKERYRQALEYMNWFQPAWNKLTEDEQYVLEIFYMNENIYGNYAADEIMGHFHIERSSVYNRTGRAVKHLQLLLYGKE